MQDSLDIQNGASGFYRGADLSKLGEELGISATEESKVVPVGGPGGGRVSPPSSRVGGGRGGGESEGGGGNGSGSGGNGFPAGVKAEIYRMGRTVSVSPKNASSASVQTPASAAVAVPAVFVPAAAGPAPAHAAAATAAAVETEAAAAAAEEAEAAAAAAAAAVARRLGSPPTGAKKKDGQEGLAGEKETKPNFDGYDFNTIRRVGSNGLPQLSASRSSGSAVSTTGPPQIYSTLSAGGGIR